jgi:hypothetical protein
MTELTVCNMAPIAFRHSLQLSDEHVDWLISLTSSYILLHVNEHKDTGGATDDRLAMSDVVHFLRKYIPAPTPHQHGPGCDRPSCMYTAGTDSSHFDCKPLDFST